MDEPESDEHFHAVCEVDGEVDACRIHRWIASDRRLCSVYGFMIG
jgi:hypothetical protein